MMGWDSPESELDEPSNWYEDSWGDLSDEQRAWLKSDLAPGELVLWAQRACPPPAPRIAAFPALFTAVLCGLSGFALMVVYGIYGLRVMDAREMLIFLGLAPAALGSVILLGLVGRWLQHIRTRWRLARTFYVLTNDRAILGTDEVDAGMIEARSVTGAMFDDTICIEHHDGSGDVFFVGDGEDLQPEMGLIGISRARQVEELVRGTLLDPYSQLD